jgi:hypothetical protein
MKIAVFWVVAPCSLIAIALMREAARTSETLVNFYQTTRCYNPEDRHLQLWNYFDKSNPGLVLVFVASGRVCPVFGK